MILIGEPTRSTALGDTIKIGRRGSVNMWIEVPGTQGHVAYPHRADNPVAASWRGSSPRSTRSTLDDGTDAFPPSNLEFTAVSTPPGASNVIPGLGDRAAQHPLQQSAARRGPGRSWSRKSSTREAPGATVERADLRRGIPDPAGRSSTIWSCRRSARRPASSPTLSTSGGTSDGRFLIQLCPVVDFGLPNATMHKVGERAAVEDIEALSRIYRRVILRKAASR